MKHQLGPGVTQEFADLTDDEVREVAKRVMAILRAESRKAEERLRVILEKARS